jgi:hypothetical protein
MRRLPGREIALAIVSMTATLLLLECSSRLLAEPPRYDSTEYDTALGHRGIPGHRQSLADERGEFIFSLNSSGFRGRELPTGTAPPGALRIAFVGDSFLVASAVRSEELLTTRVQMTLADRGVAAEVYNLSVVDYGTGQQLLLVDRLGEQIRADRVVLALYPGNDLINNSIGLAGRTSQSPADLLRPYVTPAKDGLRTRHVKPLRAWARRVSHLYALLERRLLAAYPVLGFRLPSAPVAERLRAGLAPREHLELFRHHDPASRWEEAWRTTFVLLRAFRDRCDALGARLLVLVIPTQDQVIRTARSIAMDLDTRRYARRSLEELIDWNLPERRLAAFFEAENIDARLLLEPLRAAAAKHSDVYARDGHLDRAGHEVAAEMVLDWIQGKAASGLEPAGAPTRRLPPASPNPPPLDFRHDDHLDNLAGGWLLWRSERESEEWGWWTAPRAQLVVPVGDGPLVVRGWLPEQVRPPVDLRIRGSVSHDARIDRPGAFELRIEDAVSTSVRSSEGYVSLELQAGETRVEGVPVGLVLRGIGFENDARTER